MAAHFGAHNSVLSVVCRADDVIDVHSPCDFFNQEVRTCADKHRRAFAVFGFEPVVNVFFVLIPILFHVLFVVDKADIQKRHLLARADGYYVRQHHHAPDKLKRQQQYDPRIVHHAKAPVFQRAVKRHNRLVKIVNVNLHN